MDEDRTRSKIILIPLVVLILCATALVGTLYAYSSTLTVDSNNVDAGTLTIDLRQGSADKISEDVTFSGTDIVTFTDNYEYTKTVDGNSTVWAKTNEVAYSLAGGDLVTYRVKILRDTGTVGDTVDLNINLTGFVNIVLPIYYEQYSQSVDHYLTELFHVRCTVGDGSPVELSASGTSFSATVEDVGLSEDLSVVISFEKKSGVSATGYVTGRATAVDSPASGANDAESFMDAFSAQEFGVVLTAESDST